MRALLLSSLVAAGVLVSTVAQAEPSVRQEVKVPFPFVVNGQELPAGTYTVRQDDNQATALLITGGRNAVYVLTSPIDSHSAPQDSSFVFAKDGDRYRLTQIWSRDGLGVDVTR